MLFPTWVACIPIIGIILLGRTLMSAEFQASIYALITEGTLITILAAFCLYRVALLPSEREKFSAAFAKLLRKQTAAL